MTMDITRMLRGTSRCPKCGHWIIPPNRKCPYCG